MTFISVNRFSADEEFSLLLSIHFTATILLLDYNKARETLDAALNPLNPLFNTPTLIIMTIYMDVLFHAEKYPNP